MGMSTEHRAELASAKTTLEKPGLAITLANYVGSPVELALKALPGPVASRVGTVTRKSLQAALKLALATMRKRDHRTSSADRIHKLATATSGAVGGFFGLTALAVELPVSTTLMLRSIADIARSEGEDLGDPDSALACLEVFALGGRSTSDDAAESAYFLVRLELAREVARATEYLLRKGVIDAGAPALAQFVSRIAARFAIPVSQKTALQALPLVGALGGAAMNTLFTHHYQAMARGHFTVRRLERLYGEEAVRLAYDDA